MARKKKKTLSQIMKEMFPEVKSREGGVVDGKKIRGMTVGD